MIHLQVVLIVLRKGRREVLKETLSEIMKVQEEGMTHLLAIQRNLRTKLKETAKVIEMPKVDMIRHPAIQKN